MWKIRQWFWDLWFFLRTGATVNWLSGLYEDILDLDWREERAVEWAGHRIRLKAYAATVLINWDGVQYAINRTINGPLVVQKEVKERISMRSSATHTVWRDVWRRGTKPAALEWMDIMRQMDVLLDKLEPTQELSYEY